jgi:hypothetical protein
MKELVVSESREHLRKEMAREFGEKPLTGTREMIKYACCWDDSEVGMPLSLV